MLTRFLFVSISFFFYYTTTCYAQTQPRTVVGGLRPHLSKTGLRPEPGLEQLESAEQIDSFGEIGCGGYLRHLHSENAKRSPFSLANITQRIT